MDEVLRLLRKKPRLVIITNPNNPTGTLLSKPEVERILRAAPHTAVVLDEAYAEFSGVTVVPWIRKYPHLFVVRTFSKAAGLAGLRLGAAIAQAESLDYLRRVMPPYPVNVAALVAGEAVAEDARAVRRCVREILRVRGWFEKELRRMGIKAYPSATNFCPDGISENRGPALVQHLEKHQYFFARKRKTDWCGFPLVRKKRCGELFAKSKKVF